jgi:hypothetical protein
MKRSPATWLRYFAANSRAPELVPWDRDDTLTRREARRIARSIGTFQLGEYSEGKHLRARAGERGEAVGDPALADATLRFIKEEQNHAFLLARFMRRHGLPLRSRAFTDDVFRRLRSRAGYELSITVLVVAEMIAMVYYRALRDATGSALLRAICRKILRDELQHLAYQGERIAEARAGTSPAALALKRGLHRFLYVGTLVVVWLDHAPVLRRRYRSFRRYRAEAMTVFDVTMAAGMEAHERLHAWTLARGADTEASVADAFAESASAIAAVSTSEADSLTRS